MSLAPFDLPTLRQFPYLADDLHVRVEDLAVVDQEALFRSYAGLSQLLAGYANESQTDMQRWGNVQRWCEDSGNGLAAVCRDVREIGRETLARGRHEEMLPKVLHDLRGGAVTALLGYLQLFDWLPRDQKHLKMIFVLVRDHLKIMRNGFVGLDDRRREADSLPKSHSLSLILDKWHEAVVGPPGIGGRLPPQMSVDCHYEGALTACCLESAAIDRIFYNLAANACRHCVPGKGLEMSIFPLPPDGQNLRFVLSNPVGQEDIATLRPLATPSPEDTADGIYLDTLFFPAVSSTGSGYGLTVVADFVAGAYGLTDMAAAVTGRYVGARLDGDVFRVFFHWPAARLDLPQKLEDSF